ncbi:MAG: hypothetical protein AB7U82_01155 [Blastocatellales bacterium]
MARTKSIKFPNSSDELSNLFDKLQRRFANLVFNTGALAIKQGGSALAKTANAIHFIIDGVLATKAAADMAALSGSAVPDGSKNVYVFTVNVSGTLKTYVGTASTTLAGIAFPTVADGEAVIGFIVVENGTGSNFTPGTTALDTGSLTVTYVNTPYPFIPGIETL